MSIPMPLREPSVTPADVREAHREPTPGREPLAFRAALGEGLALVFRSPVLRAISIRRSVQPSPSGRPKPTR